MDKPCKWHVGTTFELPVLLECDCEKPDVRPAVVSSGMGVQRGLCGIIAHGAHVLCAGSMVEVQCDLDSCPHRTCCHLVGRLDQLSQAKAGPRALRRSMSWGSQRGFSEHQTRSVNNRCWAWLKVKRRVMIGLNP